MPSPLILSLFTIIGLYFLNIFRIFRRNLAAAKASGLPYTFTVAYQGSQLWRVFAMFVEPVLRKLPLALTDPWLDMSLSWGWDRRYEPFKRMGSDVFFIITPGRLTLYVAEASVIAQIVDRRTDFPKPTEQYAILRIYGTNVVTTEAQQWRHHRKITSPPFSEKNNRLVWQETLRQTQNMVDSWFQAETDRSITIKTLAQDAMRLSLHIISKAGFGVGLTWPGMKAEPSERSVLSPDSSIGHKMTYTEAIGTVLHRLIPIVLMPRFLLRILPIKAMNEAYVAYDEWHQYMKEIYDKRKAQILVGEEGSSNDLMVSMLKSAGVTAQNEDTKGKKQSGQALTEEEILGNAFIFILAGHETTANSIHFTMAYLATNLSAQRHLQRDLDEAFGTTPVDEWDYETYVPKLFNNMAGAVMNEELRLIPPVTDIPKCTRSPQHLDIGGKQYTIPSKVIIHLCTPCVQRNPRHWPTGPPADPNHPAHPYSNRDNDLEEFKPERWLVTSDTKMQAPESHIASAADHTASEIIANAEATSSIFKPAKGAFIPFSEGHRSCLGRRFAQVELLAFLALVFKHYSVELSVNEWATDADVERMDAIAKREKWEKAKAKVDRQLREDLASVVTLQLQKGHFALRLVKRGKEIFDWR